MPPEGVVVELPLEAPIAVVLAHEFKTVNTPGFVATIILSVCTHNDASVTVTLYEPAIKLVAVPIDVDCAPADAAQVKIYGADPPVGVAVAVPSAPAHVASVEDEIIVIAQPGSFTAQLSVEIHPFPSVTVTE